MTQTHSEIRPYDNGSIRKLALSTIVLVCLYVTFLGTALNPELTHREGVVIFGSVLGGVLFTFFLMLNRETKQWKKLHR